MRLGQSQHGSHNMKKLFCVFFSSSNDLRATNKNFQTIDVCRFILFLMIQLTKFNKNNCYSYFQFRCLFRYRFSVKNNSFVVLVNIWSYFKFSIWAMKNYNDQLIRMIWKIGEKKINRKIYSSQFGKYIILISYFFASFSDRSRYIVELSTKFLAVGTLWTHRMRVNYNNIKQQFQCTNSLDINRVRHKALHHLVHSHQNILVGIVFEVCVDEIVFSLFLFRFHANRTDSLEYQTIRLLCGLDATRVLQVIVFHYWRWQPGQNERK